MVWAPPAMLIVLVVVAALFGLLFFAKRVISWGHEGDSEGYERRGLLDAMQERLAGTNELLTGAKELNESWKQLTGTQKGIAAEEFVIKDEMQKAEVMKRMRAVADFVRTKGPDRTLKNYGDSAINVLLGFVNKHWRIAYDEMSHMNLVLGMEDYQKKMDEFKQKQTQLSEKLTKKETKFGENEKKETKRLNKSLSKLKKQKNVPQLKNEVSGMQNFETTISKLDVQKGKRLKNQENFEKDGAKHAKEVRDIAKKFGTELKIEINLAAEFSNLLKSGKITNKNVMKYLNPLLNSTKTTENLLKKLEKAQELEAAARENELREMSAVNNLIVAIEDRSVKKLDLMRRLDSSLKSPNTGKAAAEESRNLSLEQTAAARRASWAKELQIASAQKTKINADKKASEKI